ncbi:MAG: glycosyltransferase family 4 protein [Chloroflexi bacterium]|nr:glycosyltransferase family 4 protein [Chloroflexota bacterium]
MARRTPTDTVDADLLFCPFTQPTFARDGLPNVAVVHDLQHVEYPNFFTHEQRVGRQHHVEQACARAERVVCVSDYTRQTLLAHFRVDPARVVTIRHGVLRMPTQEGASSDPPYLLYPANFWPHKNHVRLFEGLRSFRNARSALDLRLVCTGAPNSHQQHLRRVAEDMLGSDVVEFPGYVTSAALDTLLANCAALIYPSLYEGFGMPVLEAMARGKPVLCSTATSLPEVAGDAAVYFDPFDVGQMVRALECLFDYPEDVAQRVAYGRMRAAQFGDARRVAWMYQQVFEEVLAG